MKRILVVDDDVLLLRTIERICARKGWEVTTCQTLAAAEIALIRPERFAVLLTDLSIGDARRGGLAVIRIAQESDRHLPVALMSADFGDTEVPPSVLRIEKPFEPGALERVLELSCDI